MPLMILAALLGAMPAQTPAALTPAEKRAAAQAAGFRVQGNTVFSQCDMPTDQFMVERQDLNADGAPELVVSDGGGCYGNGGSMFVVLRKTATGWTQILSAQGIMNALKTRHGGWLDIEIGGPGMGKMPVARWNGTKYLY